MDKKKFRLRFSECEHDGDLNNYINDIRSCGAEILESSVDPEEEVGTVHCQIDEDKYGEFCDKFRKTDAYEFIE